MQKKPSFNNKWLALINLSFQMGLIIGLGTFTGIWLDDQIENSFPSFTIGLSLCSVFIALYNVIRQVNKMSNDKKE